MKGKLKVISLIFSFYSMTGQAQDITSNKITEKFYQLIEAPNNPEKWDAWRSGLQTWKDSCLSALQYKGDNYQKKEFQWSSQAYSTYFLMANDRCLYDKDGNYDIWNCLQKYEESYSGVDVVVLWPTYPQLGFDGRSQFYFYKNLPGGLPGLKKLCDDLHKMGKKLMIAYNPWDNVARGQGKSDEMELLELLKAIGADGVYLDTLSNLEGFFQQMQNTNPGAVFQSEIPINPEALNQVHQSWLEIGWAQKYKNLEFEEVPSLVRNRWLEQRHMIYRLSRFSHEQSTLIQNAWINGCGIVLWENVFGTVNTLNPRDRSLIQGILPILRKFTSFFTNGDWLPLYPVNLNRVYASQWQSGTNKLWTIINRQEQFTTGKLFELENVKGMKYFDLIMGTEIKPRIENNKVVLYGSFKPKGIGCILSIPEAELKREFYDFLHHQAATYKMADFNSTAFIPVPVLKPILPTKKYTKLNVPSDMIYISLPMDSVKMTFAFRQRECGFYPLGDFIDYSYSQNRNEIVTGRVAVKLTPYAIDESLVTNAQFSEFLKSSKYEPEHTENFLKHWERNIPPIGLENHPVVWISLDDARAYAVWAGKRLPTEAEWQWAAQNGVEETLYPWGMTFDSTLVNTGQYSKTTPVTYFEKGKTKTGLFDMSGNVWQLTESERSDGYNTFCILRGGAWYVNKTSEWYADQGAQPTNFGSKYLMTWAGLDRCATIGFRCVIDIKP
ncbi:MAG: SUMF1/EgtB/PvdO family nonheme iron enzyme [Saprospiraceae bacterium]